MSKQSTETQSMGKHVGGQSTGGADKEVAARSYDQAAAQERMAKLREKQKVQKEAERQRENELAKIPVNEEEVAVLAAAANWTPAVATRRLREHNGDMKLVMKNVLSGKLRV